MSDIQKLVAENRQATRQVTSNFIEVAARGQTNLSFSRNTVTVQVSIEVYTRSLNDSLISGHPNGSTHGSGQGVSGDRRGPWNLVTSSTNSAEWTKEGRQAIRDALMGRTGSLSEVGVGTGTNAAETGDSTLQNPTTRKFAWGKEAGTGSTLGVGLFAFHEHAESATEFGLFDASGRLLCRAVTDDITPSNEQEVKVGITLDVTGSGTGSSVFTTDGEEAVADSLRSDEVTVGLSEMAWGSGSSEFSKSSSSLTTEEYRQGLSREAGVESLSVESVIPRGYPQGATFPLTLSEVGVFDNKGRMLWATTFASEDKNEDEILGTSVAFLFV